MSGTEVCDLVDKDIQKEISDKLSAAKEWGSYFFSQAVKSSEEAVRKLANRIDLNDIKSAVSDVTSSVKQVPLLREFQQTQNDFSAAHQNKDDGFGFTTSQSGLPPWHPDVCGLNDPSAISSLKEQILALSQNANNFLISPPEEAQLKWTTPIPDNLLREAEILLGEDPNLGSIRYRLVPSKISEEIFWRNYFYRLSLVRQSASLSAAMGNAHLNSGNSHNTGNNSGSGSDNSVSDTDFVCVEQNPIWSKVNANSEGSEKPEVPLNNKNQKVNNSSMKSKLTSDKSLKSASLSSKEKSTTALNTSTSSPTTLNNPQSHDSSHVSTKTLEEQLEEEIAREVDELVLTKSSSENNFSNSLDNNTSNNESTLGDEIDEELELEILAELEGNVDHNRGDKVTKESR
uniref:Synapse-associated protein 1 n=1 Tax=Schistosoma japonicum TaxID=6182 RepID=C7TYI1_SCHJA|nr:Synapse-associated protein 1 [Schistosoma japonicum]